MDVGVIDRIAEQLARYPHLTYEKQARSVFVEAPAADGFSVWFSVNDQDYAVGFDGWHEHFEDQQAALDCFAMGFTAGCRLRVLRRNGIPVKWSVDVHDGKKWKLRSATGKAFTPFWKAKDEVVLQNPVAEPDA